MQLILYSGVLNQLQNWIMRKSVLSYVFYWFPFEFIYLNDIVYKDVISSRFIYMHKGILVIM